MNGNQDEKRKNPHCGHRERMRKRFAKSGFDNYHSHEVLEQILFSSIPRCNTNETAHCLIKKSGSLMNVLRADEDTLLQTNGVGIKSAEYIRSIVPKMSEMIKQQFREQDELNLYNIAFLGDWFLKYEEENKIGIIVSDCNKRFLDFVVIDPAISDGSADLYEIGNLISKKLACQRYTLLLKQENTLLSREFILDLRDYTMRLNSFMDDAFRFVGFKPISILYE